MAAIADLAGQPTKIIHGKDAVVIKQYFDGYDGGRTLDVSGYNLPEIRKGHVVIKETATNTFKPMPLNSTNDAYGSLPSGHEYVGIATHTTLTSQPFVGILTNGTVNHKAAPFDMTAILAAVKAACPQIEFRED
ncbi:hypothetical protein JGH11_19220 [Dysgonomonas sp. Marseille-P4677]|uniref:hypothetical protein n=1 Tax=Dysgonomonas sp. Marseille-P4677 TaxID=2364790 RepID=UPI001911A8E3|nr:hypothetical protein [Dysgonomonas sp. Marseille-P4677]MBK5723003.1 hypothetical protein [Dysgonomonas sp. Marseille-P4677]